MKAKTLTLQKVSQQNILQKTLSQKRYACINSACENQKRNFSKGVMTKYFTKNI